MFLWGAGEKAELVYKAINKEKCNILGIIDFDDKKNKCRWKYDDIMIFEPEVIYKYTYDFIVITPLNYAEIRKSLETMGIDKSRIICFWDEIQSNADIFLYVSLIKKIVIQKEIFECRWRNYPYEIDVHPVPKINSGEKCLMRILEKKCSLARFGDGEWEMIFQKDRPWFQKTDVKLSTRLREIILSNEDDIIIAIADNFSSLEKYTEEGADGIREYMVKSRDKIEQLLDYDREYYDSYVTRPYMIYKDKNHALKIFDLFKQVVLDRDIILVEGYCSNIGCGNDLLGTAKSVRRILCPQKNAWGKYDEILKAVVRHAKKGDLICVSLGPTATVLSYDLAKLGLQSLDIGQIDNEYDWFLRKAKNRIDIPGKFVAEVKTDFYNKDINEFMDNSTLEII